MEPQIYKQKHSKLDNRWTAERHSSKPKTNWSFRVRSDYRIIKHINSLYYNIMAGKGLNLFLMNVLLNEYLYSLRKKLAPFLPERTAKCTHLHLSKFTQDGD